MTSRVRWGVAFAIVVASALVLAWRLAARPASRQVVPAVVRADAAGWTGEVVSASGPAVGATVIGLTASDPDDSLRSACDERCGFTLLAPPDDQLGCPDAPRQLALRWKQGLFPATEVFRVTTDAQGHFTAPVPRSKGVVLWASLDEVGVAISSSSDRLVLEPAETLRGVVRDDDRRVVGGALVMVLATAYGRVLQTIADERGRFTLPLLPAGDFVVVASSDTRIASSEQVHLPNSSPMEMVLPVPRTISGQVTLLGHGVVGVEVVARGLHRIVSATTSRDGAFSIAGLQPGRYSLEAIDGERAGTLPVTVHGGFDTTGLQLQMFETATLLGMVRDEHGKPVPHAEISCTPFEGDQTIVHGDDTGAFVVRGVPPGAVMLEATAIGFQRSGLVTHHARGGQREPVELVVRSAALITGVVHDARGLPVGGAELFATSLDRDDLEPTSAGVHSDDAGTFTLDGLKRGRYDVRVEHPRFLPAHLEAAAPAQGLTLVVGDGARLSGTVLDDTGEPLAGARVGSGPGEHDTSVDHVERETTTDDAGRFVLTGLPQGDFFVGAFRDGRAAIKPVRLGSGPPFEVTLQLEAGKVISGRVSDGSSGAPIAGAEVVAESRLLSRGAPGLDDPAGVVAAISRAETVSGSDGRFTLPHLLGEGFVVSVSAAGYSGARTPMPISAGTSDLALSMRPLRAVNGRVVDSSGRPVTMFEVNGRRWQTKSGEYALPAIEAGTEKIVVVAPGFARAVRFLKIDPPNKLDDVVVTKARQLEVRVSDAVTGERVEGARVSVVPAGDDEAPAVSGRDGVVTFSGLELSNGKIEVEISHPKYGRKKVELNVSANQTRAEVSLDAGAQVTGTVKSAEGMAVAGVTVWAAPKGRLEQRVTTTSDERGRFAIAALEAGEFLVRPLGNRFSPQLVTVEAHGVKEVAFVARGRGNTVTATLFDAENRPTRASALLCPDGTAAPVSQGEGLQLLETCIGPSADWPRVVFQGVPSGRYALVIGSFGKNASVQAIELTGDRSISARLP